jgi:hypothetical protein
MLILFSLFSNPLVDVDEDYFVLHFYDLCAKQAHTFYRFMHDNSHQSTT